MRIKKEIKKFKKLESFFNQLIQNILPSNAVLDVSADSSLDFSLEEIDENKALLKKRKKHLKRILKYAASRKL